MKDLKQTIISYSSRDLEQRKNWYSPAAEAYNKARPRYPKDLIEQVVEVAQLSTDSKILEVGCGPGTATVALAKPAVGIAPLGCSIICLEPNPNFFQLTHSFKTQMGGQDARPFLLPSDYCKFWISQLLMTGLTAVAIQRQFVQNAQLPGRVSQFR